MKRIKWFGLILALCMMCTACETKADTKVAATEAPATGVPATEETAVDTQVIEPGNIHQVVIATDEIIQPIEMGKTMLADLDGDGEPEMITVRSESSDGNHNADELYFQINELHYHGGDFGKLVPSGYMNVGKNSFYLVDLDTSDRYKEILVLGWQDIDNRGYFMRYGQGKMISITGNKIYGIHLLGENVSICGDGTVRTSERGSLFEAKTFKKTWKLIDPNRFHTALEDVTEFYEFGLRSADNKLTLIQEMTFFVEMDGNLNRLLTLQAGTKIDIARYYPDTGWIQILYDDDTNEAWMKLIGDRVLLPMNIYKANIDSYIAGFSKAG